MAMVPAPGSKKQRTGQEEEEEGKADECLDRISLLPDGVLGDIVSLLPTRDGARTQVLSSRWRHIWHSAPLNITLDLNSNAPFGAINVSPSIISSILSAHQGPGRRFSVLNYRHRERSATCLDRWLKSPALDGLQELEFHYYDTDFGWNLGSPPPPRQPPPVSLHRFSTTLRIATFGGCSFPDANNAGELQFPVLRQLSLWDVRFSESFLRALRAACPVLQTLLLITTSTGYCPIRIESPTLRSIGWINSNNVTENQLLIIEDAPCLERLLSFDFYYGGGVTISVISAPKLLVLGTLSGRSPRLEFGFGTTVLQGSAALVSLKMAVHSVKVLSLTQERLSLDLVIEFMKCFPNLEKLYIKTKGPGEKNVWNKYKNLIGTIDIHLKEIVLAGYRGSTSHANFAKFFVLSARMLQSMRLELLEADHITSDAWIDRQHRLLHIKNKASRDMQLDFKYGVSRAFSYFCCEFVHDLSTSDPFS